MAGGELTADDAWRATRRARWGFWVEAFARFRYGDGSSHSRALGLQLSLAFVPLVIALVGLSGALATERMGEVLRLTLIGLSPSGSGGLVRDTLAAQEDDGSQVALWLGLLFTLGTLTTAMGQVERGANRIYGIERDRPSRLQYGRALVLALAAGLPAMAGFGLVLAGPTYGDAVEQVYGVDDELAAIIALLLWSQLTSAAIFFGLAVTAQLEAQRVGIGHGAEPDPEDRRAVAAGGERKRTGRRRDGRGRIEAGGPAADRT